MRCASPSRAAFPTTPSLGQTLAGSPSGNLSGTRRARLIDARRVTLGVVTERSAGREQEREPERSSIPRDDRADHRVAVHPVRLDRLDESTHLHRRAVT